MNKKEFISNLKDAMELHDFKSIAVGPGSVSLVRGDERIGIGYYKILDGFRLPPQVGGTKCFSEVENIIEKY